ncbi:MAG TPA: hypothetical protein PK052_11255 [Anaerohalosphaeraceae bacterium]|nr:hypothetical protein [Anaerohalosphaeraceae bacterium]HOL32546.1 hypothetical protein [Anaerohalosphaeraceae bacterium]HOM75616.1 hypothetical protein [Anaerohalosphaeraceae bacterium]HPC65248.1 hypothetical protein [Anaerohalosphaeraceae bacterium]HPO69520.1 hypothetical protein [Anaerohalosphaeraceae bacterium]
MKKGAPLPALAFWGTIFARLFTVNVAIYDETLKAQWTFNIQFSTNNDIKSLLIGQ